MLTVFRTCSSLIKSSRQSAKHMVVELHCGRVNNQPHPPMSALEKGEPKIKTAPVPRVLGDGEVDAAIRVLAARRGGTLPPGLFEQRRAVLGVLYNRYTQHAIVAMGLSTHGDQIEARLPVIANEIERAAARLCSDAAATALSVLSDASPFPRKRSLDGEVVLAAGRKFAPSSERAARATRAQAASAATTDSYHFAEDNGWAIGHVYNRHIRRPAGVLPFTVPETSSDDRPSCCGCEIGWNLAFIPISHEYLFATTAEERDAAVRVAADMVAINSTFYSRGLARLLIPWSLADELTDHAMTSGGIAHSMNELVGLDLVDLQTRFGSMIADKLFTDMGMERADVMTALHRPGGLMIEALSLRVVNGRWLFLAPRRRDGLAITVGGSDDAAGGENEAATPGGAARAPPARSREASGTTGSVSGASGATGSSGTASGGCGDDDDEKMVEAACSDDGGIEVNAFTMHVQRSTYTANGNADGFSSAWQPQSLALDPHDPELMSSIIDLVFGILICPASIVVKENSSDHEAWPNATAGLHSAAYAVIAHEQLRLPDAERNGLFLNGYNHDHIACTTNTRLKPFLEQLLLQLLITAILRGEVTDLSHIKNLETSCPAKHIDLEVKCTNWKGEEVPLGQSLTVWLNDTKIRGNGTYGARIERAKARSGTESKTESDHSQSAGARASTPIFRALIVELRALVVGELEVLLSPVQARIKRAVRDIAEHDRFKPADGDAEAEVGARRLRRYLEKHFQ